jgi:cysteinyl-tRNA synthetase
MIAGARVEVAPYKQHPADFVLWKPSKAGEPVWESPFGPGRPGWHIECSAMIDETLGLPIDIHGGGNDLIFPHHENEIAQGLCARRAPSYANYWMHNGFVNSGSQKMSKSLENVELVHDLVSRWPPEALRWALLASHYRQPMAWTDAVAAQARNSLDTLYGALRRAGDAERVEAEPSAAYLDALNDDLNTPRANAHMFVLAQELENASAADRPRLRAELLACGRLAGFLQADPEAWFQGGADPALKARIEALLERRAEARAAKDWVSADRIREELAALNVEVMDSAGGVTWTLKQPTAG